MEHVWLVLVALIVGCGYPALPRLDRLDASGVSDGAPPDVLPDVPPDAPCIPWDALNLSPNVTPCDVALGVPRDLALPAGAYTIDTDSGQLSGAMTAQLPGALIPQSGLMLRVVNLGQLSIAGGATVSITGTHPLVFVVHADAMIAGTVDVSARVDGTTGSSTAGPGGDDSGACAGGFGAIGGPATVNGSGGGGAGGGSFGDTGGPGGDGAGTDKGIGRMGGIATGSMMLVPMRGGCPGGQGGAAAGVVAGTGGAGGGALEVTARGVMDVIGTLKAAGGGGGTPMQVNAGGGSGGGGGGSGGAILLDGDVVHVEASSALCATGGGGGEGGGTVGTSMTGANGTCSATQGAFGGTGNADGGDGGMGGWISVTVGRFGGSGGNSGGGGGGGGSVGRIRVRGRTTRTIDSSALVSPAAAP